MELHENTNSRINTLVWNLALCNNWIILDTDLDAASFNVNFCSVWRNIKSRKASVSIGWQVWPRQLICTLFWEPNFSTASCLCHYCLPLTYSYFLTVTIENIRTAKDLLILWWRFPAQKFNKLLVFAQFGTKLHMPFCYFDNRDSS